MGPWLTALLLAPLIILAGLSLASRKPPILGVKSGHLLPCPSSPNCVNSEDSGGADVPPLSIPGAPVQAWAAAREAVRQGGGAIVVEGPGYLRATFTTPLLRFIDDLELRLDEQQGVIHIRSASRVGRSDFGANKKRVKQITQLYCRNAETSCP